MPLIDKFKATATQLAQKAQEAGKVGQAKVEDYQARRRADGLLRSLGAAVYADRTGTADTATTSAKVDELVNALKAHEAANGPIDARSADDGENDSTD